VGSFLCALPAHSQPLAGNPSELVRIGVQDTQNMSKRKWKVYTTDELRDRFQPKPGSNAIANDDQKVVIPNLKRRNSAPPGMIHFPPGTFSASSGGNQQNSHQPPSNTYLFVMVPCCIHVHSLFIQYNIEIG
jgi:hypothetical protein